MGQSQWKAILQCDRVSRKLIKQCGIKGTQDISSVGPISKAPQRVRIGFLGSKLTAPSRPWPQAITGFAKSVPGFRWGTTFVSTHQGFRKSLGLPGLPTHAYEGQAAKVILATSWSQPRIHRLIKNFFLKQKIKWIKPLCTFKKKKKWENINACKNKKIEGLELRALAAFVEDPGSISSNYTVAHNCS